ncbi:MAG: N-acetylmuramoyl-L-alanine amidase [Campylobacterales bacterium]|nr:N-acetylmuramoyl-L-alanine amidase [Campylobacterales bacterium]
MKIFITLLLICIALLSQELSDTQLKDKIARMIIIGFDGATVNENSQIVKDLKKYPLGGVILFDREYKNRDRVKNISSPKQLATLTQTLQNYAKEPLFISVDQEGGKVARLKSEYGFLTTPCAAKVGKMPYEKTLETYMKQSQMLEDMGINMNFAPVVDLAINPKNKVIVGLERSFGREPKRVYAYAKVLIEAQKAHNIVSVLKHFPGHGSSLGDSHKGFVDVSESWSPEELEPYMALIKENEVDAIMTAHVYNAHIDSKYPATLSYKFNTELLRNTMGYKGVIISDDLQMGAISEHYTLKERLKLAINAGVDMVLFGNQLSNVSTEKLVNTIFTSVKSGEISQKRIEESAAKIETLLTQNSIVQKPIIFTQKRKEMTKEYIKSHYDLDVKSIEITPKMLVLHWTAVMDFNDSFTRLYPEELYSDRKDIVNASSLNVSAHFLVDRDGTIYQLMPDNWMARHVIGLNYFSIGVENVGGEGNAKEDLTPQQLKSNIRLVQYLKAKYPSIKHVIGHHEYREYENSPLWLERDTNYRTQKADPGEKFMKNVRDSLDWL